MTRNEIAEAVANTLKIHLAKVLDREHLHSVEPVVIDDVNEPVASVGFTDEDGEVHFVDVYVRAAADDEEYFSEIEEAYESPYGADDPDQQTLADAEDALRQLNARFSARVTERKASP